MFERVCLVHYHEIGLKGRNRAQFERRLRDNLEAALVGLPVSRDRAHRLARRSCASREPERAVEVAERIARDSRACSPSRPRYRTRARSATRWSSAALLAIREAGAFATFRVESRRSNTDYPVPSMEINRSIGAFLQARDRARRQPLGARRHGAHRRRAGQRLRLLARDRRVSADCRSGMSGTGRRAALGGHRLAGGDAGA